ncbi:EamA family transporter [Epibacterium sp. SM1979]|uniref:EamA family transporter n=1 Tax=Tritonibacter litoralis TaxID=2662264 RepID=A0A843YFX6_9RHOB|nr:DMT family transporter [Tritonibacter litoralis]MQQ08019.1 EamA family transporter [Tritonibacter litoralis]
MIATLGFVWGGTFLVAELALRGITPFWLAAGRIGFAALLLTVIWGLLGFRLFEERSNWVSVCIIALFSTALPFALLSWGLVYVTSGFAGVSMGAIPLMILPLAHVFVAGEQMGPRRIIGTVLGFLGILILIGGKAFDSSGSDLEWAGRAACILAAACYAGSSILTRRLPPVDSVGLATVLMIIGAVVIIPLAWVVEGPLPPLSQETLFWVALLGLVPTAGANLLRVLVVRGAGPVFMSLTNYQVPIWSVVLGAVILSEPLPASLLLALALVFSGLVLGQWQALKQLFHKI